MLLIPYVVGAAAAGSFGLDAIAGLAAILMMYVSRPGFTQMLKKRFRSGGFGPGARRLMAGSLLLALAALAILAWLCLARGYRELPWFLLAGAAIAGPHTLLSVRRRERTAPVEFAGIVLLTMSAPLAFYLASGEFSRTTAGLWILSALYFGASVYFVKMKLMAKLAGRRGGGRPLKAGSKLSLARSTIFYLIVMGAAVLLAQAAELSPALAWLAYVPVAIYMTVSIIRLGPRVDIKREGWSQAALSVLFAVMLAASYHL